MNIAIIGGKLQGLEACYLAKKAGWNTLLIDKNKDIPAYYMCDHFIQFDIKNWPYLSKEFRDVDILIPALENWQALNAIEDMSDKLAIPCIFDRNAYMTTSSKNLTNILLDRIDIPIPTKWPGCGFPVIIKPDCRSGSEGVQICTRNQQKQLAKYLFNNWTVQEYIPGQLFSLEVVGFPGHYETLLVTDLAVDSVFDCKRVIAPSKLDEDSIALFRHQAEQIAEAIELNGIMDIESILHEGKLRTLEIDARLPSQTPTAVYWSSGCNMLESCLDLYFNRSHRQQMDRQDYVIYEHIAARQQKLYCQGEHIIAESSNLFLIENFFGADEAITNVESNPDEWVATLIFVDQSPERLQIKRSMCYEKIIDNFSLNQPWEDFYISNFYN